MAADKLAKPALLTPALQFSLRPGRTRLRPGAPSC